MKFYSQHGEDCLLWEFFGHKTQGFYVDVGAFDGVHISNSYGFERVGWSGICIEPLPAMFSRCQSQRPDATCLNVACVADDTQTSVTFYVEPLGLLSGVQAGREDDVRRRYEKRGLEFSGFEAIHVPARTLNSLLAEYLPAGTPVDFMSIDVEGTELDVLRGLDLARYQPRLLILEANTRDERTTLNAYLAENGYHPARRLGVNMIFARTEQDIHALRSIRVDCEIEPTEHPLGTAFTPAHAVRHHRITAPAEVKTAPSPLNGIKHRIKRLLRL